MSTVLFICCGLAIIAGGLFSYKLFGTWCTASDKIFFFFVLSCFVVFASISGLAGSKYASPEKTGVGNAPVSVLGSGVPTPSPEQDSIPKKRIIVVDFEGTQTNREFAGLGPVVRKNIEHILINSGGFILVADEGKREEIIRQLYKYQEGRSLYDKETLAKIGDFWGATHGVFGSIKQGDGFITFECKIINLETAEEEQSVQFNLKVDPADDKQKLLDYGSGYLADSLVSKFTELTIDSPANGTWVGGPQRPAQLVVEGHAFFLPQRWKLWVTVSPEGVASHYPQQPITVQDDGSWRAPSVYVGDKLGNDRDQRFVLYIIMSDEMRNDEIRRYLVVGQNDGIDLSLWPKDSYRNLGSITVIRSAGR